MQTDQKGLMGVLISGFAGLYLATWLNIPQMVGNGAIGAFIGSAVVIALVYWAYEKYLSHRSASTHALTIVFLAGLVGQFVASFLNIGTYLGTGQLPLLIGSDVVVVLVYWAIEKYAKF